MFVFRQCRGPRRLHPTTFHSLEAILLITILGTICGAENSVEIEQWGQTQQAWLSEFLALPHGTPSHDTFKRPTMAEKLPFVLSYAKTSPPFDVLGMPCAMARSKAHENLHRFSPILYDTLGQLALMPSREWASPEELKAALQGGDRLLIEATERA